jgi:hypothetical protein
MNYLIIGTIGTITIPFFVIIAMCAHELYQVYRPKNIRAICLAFEQLDKKC